MSSVPIASLGAQMHSHDHASPYAGFLDRKMDRSFSDGPRTEERLKGLLESIGKARTNLRFAHLRAHLQLIPLLVESQREHYLWARGYGG